MSRLLTLCLAACVAGAFCLPAAWGQNKGKNNKNSAQEKKDDQRIQNEKKDVEKAQNELKQDVKELQDAQKAQLVAEAKEKELRQQVDEVRKRVEAKHEKSSGVDKALAEQTAAQTTYDEAAAPVLKSLKASPEYQAAVQKVEAAKVRQRLAREDKVMTDAQKKKELAASSKDALAVSELEQRTLADQSGVKTAREKLAKAQAHVNELRQRIRDSIENDGELKSIVTLMQDADRAADQARAKVAKIRQEVAGDQVKIVREQQQVNQAIAADKANDNNNKNNKNAKRPATKRKR